MNTQSIVLVAMLLVACGGEPATLIALDAGYPVAPEDAEVMTDAGAAVDAAPSDGGTYAPPDAGQRDSGPGTDASLVPDAGAPLDAGAVRPDSGPPATDAGTDAGTTDAGSPVPDAGPPPPPPPPSAPVGVAVDITSLNCALDEAGNLWCWERWDTGLPVGLGNSSVRYLGGPFVDAAGACAQRADRTVWCADFGALTMVEIMRGDAILRVDTIAEHSDLAFGCGLAGGEALCWTNGGSVTRLDVRQSHNGALTDEPATAVWVALPWRTRSAAALSAPYDGYRDTCYSRTDSALTSCYGFQGPYTLPRTTHSQRILGNAWECGFGEGRIHCTGAFGTSTQPRTISTPLISNFRTYGVGHVRSRRDYRAIDKGFCYSQMGGINADQPFLACWSVYSDGYAQRSYTVNW
jgi:hypothetical protein